MASAVGEPPSILDRMDRLDALLGYLERRESRAAAAAAKSPRASTTSSGTVTTSDGGNSSVNSSPKCLSRRWCRPVHDVLMEVQAKGSLMDRVDHLEHRLLKIEDEKKREEAERSPRSGDKSKHGKGLKSLVKSCVKGSLKTKD
ncbi:uncharacterized protein LOC103717801 [Phoenix dactylifera]|uniref:Uncharacterized protein LOC103717801 n=1 Tax=Phoenix dactylifera TaxID=42345 RepID=A0A8B7CQY3_PHODC|nr:uncharacterized protein LOC103717801 [Phoenix dactylifera]